MEQAEVTDRRDENLDSLHTKTTVLAQPEAG